MSRHNYQHTVFNAKLPERPLPPTPEPENRRHLSRYDENELTPRNNNHSRDSSPPPPPPHYSSRNGETLKQHVDEQRKRGFSHPKSNYQDQNQDVENEAPTKCGSVCPATSKERANCCTCFMFAVVAYLVICAIIGVIFYHMFYCEFTGTESKALNRPNFYMGCGGDYSSYCSDYYGFEFDGQTKDNSRCCPDQDEDILCVYTNTIPTLPTTDVTAIKAMSFNIYEQPLFTEYTGQRERSCRVPGWIIENVPEVDIIGFQEVFTDGCWGGKASLDEILSHHGISHHSKTVGDSSSLTNGGTFIASKWPIEEEQMYIFDNIISDEGHHIPLGINYVQITKTDGAGGSKSYHFFNTNFQATKGESGNEIRENQAREMKEFIDDQNIPSDEPVIILGSFHVDYYTQVDHFNNIFNDTLQALEPNKMTALNYTYDAVENSLTAAVKSETVRERLDYIVYLSNNEQPSAATFDILKATSDSPFKMCWCPNCPSWGTYRFPDSGHCDKTEEFNELSDHFPVIADFDFS